MHAFGFFLLPLKLKLFSKARESTATTNKQTNKQQKIVVLVMKNNIKVGLYTS